ncbi:MAG TPA: methylated-DNA--[protein]-cysteine S-methyltransferase [Allosphingosinicella sp.]|nr:methylated-DNA--[protein]-cysteine S-methyltransferase [Allosphingosinicella sp.]
MKVELQEIRAVSRSEYALFETAIGLCAIVWSARGIVGTQLPESGRGAAVRGLQRRFPDAHSGRPTPAIAAAMARIEAALAGAKDDFAGLALDWRTVSAFDRAVYQEARAIPAGETITYGTLAARLGDPGRAQAVGQALGRNPWPIVVPCHRITGADGKMGGFSAPGGRATKLKLLEIEGALAAESLPLFGAPTRS